MEHHTQRFLLRDFREDAWPAVLAHESHPRYLRFYASKRAREEVQAFLRRFHDNQRQQPRYKFQLAIELSRTGQLIGSCRVCMKASGRVRYLQNQPIPGKRWSRSPAGPGEQENYDAKLQRSIPQL